MNIKLKNKATLKLLARVCFVAALLLAAAIFGGLFQPADAQGLVGAPVPTCFGRHVPEPCVDMTAYYMDFLLRSFFSGVFALFTVTALPSAKWLDWGVGRKFCFLFLSTAVPATIFLVLMAIYPQPLLLYRGGL